jgi:hypothetical protein
MTEVIHGDAGFIDQILLFGLRFRAWRQERQTYRRDGRQCEYFHEENFLDAWELKIGRITQLLTDSSTVEIKKKDEIRPMEISRHGD